MKVALFDTHSCKPTVGIILAAGRRDMPTRKAGWKFSWKQLYGVEGAEYYKLCLNEKLSDIQGLMMLSLMNQEMLYLNNIEVAPHNYGGEGKFDNVAGALLAYGSLLSFEKGVGAYLGFLSFDSKTELIPMYMQKYGATHAGGQKMYLDPKSGRELIKKYLNRSFYD